MAMTVPEVEETSMNMTPMIDIVFQLIVFFLLTLRFSTPEYRIDSQLPKDRGLAATPQFVSDLQAIKVKVFRKDKDKGKAAWTKVKVGNDWEDKFPAEKDATGESETAREESLRVQYEKTLARVKAKIQEEWAKKGNDPEQKGEIDAKPPDGPSVPHGEVVMLLDAFLQTGIKTVNFEGAPAPVSRSEGGHGP